VAVRIAQVFWACFGLVGYALFTARQPGPAFPLIPAKQNGDPKYLGETQKY